MSIRRTAVLAALAACGAPVRHPAAHAPAAAVDITLFRDVALVRQRITAEVGESRQASIAIAQGAAAETITDVTVLDRGGLVSATVRVPVAAAVYEDDEEGAMTVDEHGHASPQIAPDSPVRLDVTAPRPGRYTVEVSYVANGLHWDAGYTVTTTAARDRAEIQGALAVHDTMKVAFEGVALRVIDAELGGWRTRSAEQLAAALVGAEPSTTPRAVARDLGVHDLAPGDTRIDLQPARAPRRMRSVLVYDPIGTTLDHAGAEPVLERDLGVSKSASTVVTESLEIERDVAATVGLPAGPVRLLEQHEDGSFSVLGDAQLFEAATRVATIDTIPLGTAEGVTGHRERIELTIDDDGKQKRVVEEFAIEIANERTAPIDVLIREHLYRGLNWAVAYHSSDARQEGAQQMATRSRVPARGKTKIMYVVVYSSPK